MALLKVVRPVRVVRLSSDKYNQACQHLSQSDQVLRTLIVRLGPCSLKPRRQYFAILCDSIVSQQLSARVAEVIFDRFVALYRKSSLTPSAVARTSLSQLCAVGLSRQKASYVKDLASGFLDGRIRPRRLVKQSNDEIVETLVSIHGIGRWTAEMFLIFSLNRLDVLPVDDLGIKRAIQRWYNLPSLPTSESIRAIGKPWRPYESIACWYLWRSLALED